MKKYFPAILLSLILLSCESETKQITLRPVNPALGGDDSVMVIPNKLKELPLNVKDCATIKVPDSRNFVEAQSLLDSCMYIPLETNEECLISKITKLIITDDRIFVLDNLMTDNLYAFSKEGRFLCKYGNIGRGPGEFTSLIDFTIDKEHGKVILYDGAGKIIYYSLNGEYLYDVPVYYNFRKFNMTNGKLVLQMRHTENEGTPFDNYNIVVADSTFHPVAKSFMSPFPKTEFQNTGGKFHILNNLDDIYVKSEFSDTIWMYNQNEWIAKYAVLTSKSPLIPYDQWSTLTEERYKEITSGKIRCYDEDYSEVEDFAYFFIENENNTLFPLIYDKTTQKVCYDYVGRNKYKSVTLDLFSYPFTWYAYDNKRFVSARKPSQILDCVRYNEAEGIPLTPEEKKLKETLTEEDNPVLMVFSLKHF